jgi:tetratricopeptide (TPR) repeat protein
MHSAPNLVAAPENAQVWNVPHPRDPEFCGRDAVLASLRTSLTAKGAARVQVVHGAGGIGKTQLVAEYAHRHRHNYGLVWWLPAYDRTALALSFSKLTARLGLRGVSEANAEDVRRELRRALDKWEEWLIVFDDAPGPEAVRSFLPEPGDGHVLVTSRQSNWRGVGPGFCLRGLARPDAVEFLKRRTGHPKAEGHANTLAQALADVPLALAQAGSTIRESGINFGEYLSRYESHWAELLGSGRPPADYPDTVLMSGELALRAAEDAAPEAVALLKVWSFLAPADLPRGYLNDAAGFLPAPLSQTAGTASDLDDALADLRRFALVAPGYNPNSVAIPRITASIVQDRLGEVERHNWCDVAVRMVEATFKFDGAPASDWETLGERLPHALAAAGHAEALGVAPAAAAKLLNQAGQYLYLRGEYFRAKDVLARSMALCDRAYGPNNPRRAAVANNLGRALRRLGDLRAAREQFQAAMAVDQASYGHAHPHVAEAANNYGICLQMSGDVESARRQFEWALSVCEPRLGRDHPKVAALVNNLGYALKGLGEYDAALDHFARALSITESTYGVHHPTVAHINSNLGIALRLRGEPRAAKSCFERAVVAVEHALGPSHPELARHLTLLGLHLQEEEGDLEAALKLFERASAIEERAFGPSHVTLLARLNYLGRCLKAMGRVDESAECYARGAGILRQLRDAQGDDSGAGEKQVIAAAEVSAAAEEDAAAMFCVDDSPAGTGYDLKVPV